MDRVRLGLIGCGWIAAPHVRAIAELADRCSLVWAADPDAERADRVAARAGCRALADYHEGLAEVDAVIVATPHHLHAPIVMDAAQAGKHILVEKPLATTLDDADRMLQAVDEAGVSCWSATRGITSPSSAAYAALIESRPLRPRPDPVGHDAGERGRVCERMAGQEGAAGRRLLLLGRRASFGMVGEPGRRGGGDPSL